ncbi:MAG: DNA cytosine methyltransferase [Solirubrobacteraceae bacterium]|nr:DNA cytosine methyltransferase [Solirubrobacteraceae bacterium]
MFAPQGTLALDFAASGDDARMPGNVTGPDFSAISLYCGAGGLDLGFTRAGFRVRWAIDRDPYAIETYNANLEPYGCCGDVLEVEPPTSIEPDLIIGGPPCQGFSVIGQMDPDDPRSRHVDHFFDVVERLRPRAFVMENVKALGASPRWEHVRRRLLDRAERLGYGRRLFILNAQDFNVPQSRERMFLVGILDGIPDSPAVTTADRPPTVRDALAGLPRIGEPGNDQLCAARVIPARSPIMRPTAHRGSLLFNGSGRPLQLDAPAKTLPASMGGNATPIIDQDELEHGAAPWVIDYHLRLQHGGRPLKRAPKRLRRITVQEAAALQTFPPEWRFAGTRVAQYRQIGNAVPPNLAEAVARCVRAALERAGRRACSEIGSPAHDAETVAIAA